MLIFRVKEVLVKRETTNALLLLPAELLVDLFLVTFAFGTGGLTRPAFFACLAGYVLLSVALVAVGIVAIVQARQLRELQMADVEEADW